MSTRSKVLFGNNLAGYLEKYDNGYRFTYDSKFKAPLKIIMDLLTE